MEPQKGSKMRPQIAHEEATKRGWLLEDVLIEFGSPEIYKMRAFGEQQVSPTQLWTNFGSEEGDREFDW